MFRSLKKRIGSLTGLGRSNNALQIARLEEKRIIKEADFAEFELRMMEALTEGFVGTLAKLYLIYKSEAYELRKNHNRNPSFLARRAKEQIGKTLQQLSPQIFNEVDRAPYESWHGLLHYFGHLSAKGQIIPETLDGRLVPPFLKAKFLNSYAAAGKTYKAFLAPASYAFYRREILKRDLLIAGNWLTASKVRQMMPAMKFLQESLPAARNAAIRKAYELEISLRPLEAHIAPAARNNIARLIHTACRSDAWRKAIFSQVPDILGSSFSEIFSRACKIHQNNDNRILTRVALEAGYKMDKAIRAARQPESETSAQDLVSMDLLDNFYRSAGAKGNNPVSVTPRKNADNKVTNLAEMQKPAAGHRAVWIEGQLPGPLPVPQAA